MSNKTKEENAITIAEVKKKARGTLVEIPDWEPNKTIKVRLRSIDVSPILLESGTIPDELSLEVATMFGDGDKKDSKEPSKKPAEQIKGSTLKKFLPVLDAIAKESLAEPTFEEITEVYPLTIQQKMAIFSYVMEGVRKLKPFRD